MFSVPHKKLLTTDVQTYEVLVDGKTFSYRTIPRLRCIINPMLPFIRYLKIIKVLQCSGEHQTYKQGKCHIYNNAIPSVS